MIVVDLAVDGSDVLGESALWVPESGTLFWLDLMRPKLSSLVLATGEFSSKELDPSVPLGALVRSVIPGQLVLARRNGVILLNPADGAERPLAHPASGRDDLGYNDAAADRQGRLWIGTCELSESHPAAVLYAVEADGSSEIADDGFIVCNGPVFSPDGSTMYFSDTLSRTVLAYDLDGGGRLGGKRVFARIDESDGFPDGLAIDSEGGVWVAHWGAGRISRWSPQGVRSETVLLPTTNVTSLAFAGPELSTLFVTTASDPCDDGPATPGAGALYVLEPGVSGAPDWPCALGVA
jgi:D-xylonolactonase